MATTTANYGLTKPERSDNYSVDVMSGNMDKIDSAIKTETDAVAAKVSALEPLLAIEVDENQNVTFPANVNADLSSSMNLTTESGKISAIYLSTNVLLGESQGTAVTNTYTYVANPISNTVEFAYTAYGQSGSSTRQGRVYISINGTIVADTGTVTSTTSGSYRTTLENNDVIEVYVYTNYKSNTGSLGSTVYLKCYGYLTN